MLRVMSEETQTEVFNATSQDTSESDPVTVNSTRSPSYQHSTSNECSKPLPSSLTSTEEPPSHVSAQELEQSATSSELPYPLVKSPTQEQSKADASQSETTLSARTANVTAQWRTLCEESERLSKNLIAFASRLNLVNGNCGMRSQQGDNSKTENSTSELQPDIRSTGNDETGAAKEREENIEMLHADIKEAVEMIKNLSKSFNEMDEKIKQWVPVAVAAKVQLSIEQRTIAVHDM